MNAYKRAIKDKFLKINKKEDIVIYLPQNKRRKLSNPEEKVQLEAYLKLIYELKYPPERIRVSEKVKMGSSSREADIVVYKDKGCTDPLIVVECKKRGISRKAFVDATDQGFSYAAVTQAEYVWVTSGDKDAYYEVWENAIRERKQNRIRRLPLFRNGKKASTWMGRLIRSVKRRPVLSDSILYGAVLFFCVWGFSKLAVEFHQDIYPFAYQHLGKYGMDLQWIFNGIVLLSTLFSLVFGGIFMRTHQFFRLTTGKKRTSYFLITLILFAPAWYMGTTNTDPNWWQEDNLLIRQNKIFIYIWPYLKSFGVQILAIYGLLWLLGRQKAS